MTTFNKLGNKHRVLVVFTFQAQVFGKLVGTLLYNINISSRKLQTWLQVKLQIMHHIIILQKSGSLVQQTDSNNNVLLI